MTGPRIGSLFTGTGALDLAVMDVLGGEVAWHSQYEPPDKNGREDTNQYAARILARHWPTVPNLGDITKVDWQAVIEEHGPIDILTGGFPCTDVSSAGKRAGLTPETRSGLWSHMARAINVLRPPLVVIENVQGLLSAPAAGDLEPCTDCVGDGSAEPSLRALGAVLGDLASLGFDAEWCVLAASEVGAPHPRKRIFIVAWPAATDADGGESERRRIAGLLGSPEAAELGERDQRERAGHAAGHRGETAADAEGLGRREGRAEPARLQGGPDAAERGVPALELRPGFPDISWGEYGPAIRRWEHILGRRAPWPTDVRGRLSPVFTEWMMGLPDGWVTATPGLTRSAMLKALGNGVVRQQAAAALRLLLARADASAPLLALVVAA